MHEAPYNAAYAWAISGVAVLGGLLFGYDWVVIAEIFPNRIRGIGMSLAVSSLWIASFILTYTFPLLNHRFARQ